ncbi:MAG: hypothetical protein M3O15_03735 [Acidobacteriota bacterium]|nr:hypothetical protein [Acidobacteriota bacterium]
MQKKQTLKMSLNRETLVHLGQRELQAAGGILTPSNVCTRVGACHTHSDCF